MRKFFRLSTILIVASCLLIQCKSSRTQAISVGTAPKIGIQTWTFRMFTFEQALAKADSAGVKNIEAYWGQAIGAGTADSFGIRMSAATQDKIEQMLNAKGISIVAMGVIVPSSRDQWQKAFELARRFHLSYITSEPKKDQWDMIDTLAGEYHIPVAVHEHPRPNAYWHPDSVLAAIKNHPNIGACADLGHWARSGLDPVDCLKKLEGHIIGVHLKDIAVFNDPKAADVPVSKGVLNYPSIFAELKRQNFKGMMSIEQESNWYNSLPEVTQTVTYYRSMH